MASRKRGRLTDVEKLQIEQLVTTMEKPTPGKVAAKLNRHPATINWFMLTRGLIERTPGRAPHAYERNGKTIHPYLIEHDAFIDGKRAEGLNFREIGELVTKEFGIPRTGHSVRVRIIQLAAAPDETLAPPPATKFLTSIGGE